MVLLVSSELSLVESRAIKAETETSGGKGLVEKASVSERPATEKNGRALTSDQVYSTKLSSGPSGKGSGH